jgi:DNA-binding NarL/FixJ family response regulator
VSEPSWSETPAAGELPLILDNGPRYVGTIGVLLVASDAERRAFLRRCLEAEGVGIVGETDDPKECLELATRTRPHLVLVDLPHASPGLLRAIRILADSDPPVPALVIVQSRKTLLDAIRAGARGRVRQGSPTSSLLEGMKTLVLGRMSIYPPPPGAGAAVEDSLVG